MKTAGWRWAKHFPKKHSFIKARLKMGTISIPGDCHPICPIQYHPMALKGGVSFTLNGISLAYPPWSTAPVRPDGEWRGSGLGGLHSLVFPKFPGNSKVIQKCLFDGCPIDFSEQHFLRVFRRVFPCFLMVVHGFPMVFRYFSTENAIPVS